MLEWIEKVWKPFVQDKPLTYPVIDEFSAHMTEAVGQAFGRLRTVVDFVVGGYTSKLQTLDVGVNKPFKGYMRDQFEQFMISYANRTPHRLEVSHWVVNSWEQITTSTILNTWRPIGIGQASSQAVQESQRTIEEQILLDVQEESENIDLFDPMLDFCFDSTNEEDASAPAEEEQETTIDELEEIQLRLRHQLQLTTGTV